MMQGNFASLMAVVAELGEYLGFVLRQTAHSFLAQNLPSHEL